MQVQSVYITCNIQKSNNRILTCRKDVHIDKFFFVTDQEEATSQPSQIVPLSSDLSEIPLYIENDVREKIHLEFLKYNNSTHVYKIQVNKLRELPYPIFQTTLKISHVFR
jgi:hypothetical protein